MLRYMQRLMMVVAFVGLAGAASAQGTELLKYDVQMKSALKMHGSTYVLPPGEYRLEQFSQSSPNLFLLRQKEMNGQFSEPLAVLDAWQVPYSENNLGTSGVKLVTDPEAGGVAVLRGWQIGTDYWQLRDVATLDNAYFAAR